MVSECISVEGAQYIVGVHNSWWIVLLKSDVYYRRWSTWYISYSNLFYAGCGHLAQVRLFSTSSILAAWLIFGCLVLYRWEHCLISDMVWSYKHLLFDITAHNIPELSSSMSNILPRESLLSGLEDSLLQYQTLKVYFRDFNFIISR